MHKFSCANLSRVVFPKLSLLRETKQVLPLPSQDALGTSELCCPFLCHTQHIFSADFSAHCHTHCTQVFLCSKTCLLSPPLVPSHHLHSSSALKVTLHASFLSLSLVFNTHSAISSLFATAPTAATAPAQLLPWLQVHWGCRIHPSFQEQHEEEQ